MYKMVKVYILHSSYLLVICYVLMYDCCWILASILFAIHLHASESLPVMLVHLLMNDYRLHIDYICCRIKWVDSHSHDRKLVGGFKPNHSIADTICPKINCIYFFKKSKITYFFCNWYSSVEFDWNAWKIHYVNNILPFWSYCTNVQYTA